MPRLDIPEPLQKYTEGKRQLSLTAKYLSDLPSCLQSQNPALYQVLFNKQGKLCGYANLYLDGVLVSNQLTQAIELKPSGRLSLVAAVSGG